MLRYCLDLRAADIMTAMYWLRRTPEWKDWESLLPLPDPGSDPLLLAVRDAVTAMADVDGFDPCLAVTSWSLGWAGHHHDLGIANQHTVGCWPVLATIASKRLPALAKLQYDSAPSIFLLIISPGMKSQVFILFLSPPRRGRGIKGNRRVVCLGFAEQELSADIVGNFRRNLYHHLQLQRYQLTPKDLSVYAGEEALSIPFWTWDHKLSAPAFFDSMVTKLYQESLAQGLSLAINTGRELDDGDPLQVILFV